MAVLYTQAEVEARVAQASPPLVVLDRRFDIALPEQDELILGIQDVVGRCLNSDADGLFYLVGLAARTNAALAQRIGTNLTQFSRLAEAGNQEPPVATPAVDLLLGLLDQVENAGDGQQEKIRQQFSTAVAAYARSSRTSAGAISVRPDPESSRQSASLLVTSILEDSALLLDNARLFVDAITNFKAVDFTKASRDRHILYARILLQNHLGRAVTEQSDAIIDSIVANTLLQYSAVRLDVEAAKAAGTFAMSALSEETRVITLLTAPSINAPIRIGDGVFATALAGGTYPVRVGTVTWVEGLQVTMTEAQGSGLPVGAINQPNAQYQIQILAQGLVNFRSISPQVAANVTQLANLLEGENRIQRALATYVESGVISPKFSSSIQGLTSLSTNLVTLFGQYAASRVQVVDGLISHLENERLDLLSSVLTGLQFSVLLDIPSVLSSQGQATYLMEELAEDANTGVEPQVNEIASMMGDYFISGRP